MSRGAPVLAAAVAGIVALLCLGLLAASCGAGSKSPTVASLGTTPSSRGTSGGPSTFALPPGGARIGASISTQVGAGGVGYTGCMRSHGLPNFPDPDARGTITITVSTSLDPASPVFRRAEADCRHLLPAGKAPTQARQQRIEAGALAFAACMRSHEVPSYPDPKFDPGGTVSQGYSRSMGVDPSSPIFQAAQNTCRSRRDRSR